MPVAQTVTYKCSKCFWRRTATYGDTQPILVPDRCPRCGSPTAKRTATPIERAFGHGFDAMPLTLTLGVAALALDALLKLASNKGE